MTNLNGVCLCVFCVVLQNKRVFEVYRVSDCLVLFAGFFCPNTLQGCPMVYSQVSCIRHLGFIQEELESVARDREVWTELLSLLLF